MRRRKKTQTKLLPKGLADTLFTYSSDLLVCLDSDLNVITFNPKVENYFGLNKSSLIKHADLKFYSKLSSADKENLLKGKKFVKRCEISLPNRRKKIVMWNFIPMGNLILLIGKALKKRPKRKIFSHSLLMRAIHDAPVRIYWKDKKGTLIGCNVENAKTFGFNSPNSLIGKSEFEFLSEGDAKFIGNIDKKMMNTGKPSIIEETMDLPDGKKKTYIFYKTALKSKKGNAVGIMVFAADITKKIKERQKLEKHETEIQYQLESLVDSVPGSIYWKNRDGVYLGCNEYMVKLGGLKSKQDIRGKTDEMLWGGESAKNIRQNDLKVMETGKPINIEEIVSFEGKKYYFTVVKQPLRNKDGKIIGVLGNSLDIAELKETQLALQHAKVKAEAANQAKTQFIANISHDIRTPLVGIKGIAEQMTEKVTPELQADMKSLVEASNELLVLLNEVIGLSKLEFSELQKQTMPFNLHRLIHQIVALFAPAAKEKRIQLLENYKFDGSMNFEGDPLRLHRTILNLVGNALKFTHQGQVVITAEIVKVNEQNKCEVKVSVKDTGIGISKSEQKKIFQSFYRVAPSYQGKFKGSGLGLYITKQLVEQMNGSILLESHPGKGSTFTIMVNLKKIESVNEETISYIEQEYVQDAIDKIKLEELQTENQEKILSVKMNPPEFKYNTFALLVEDNPMIQKVSSGILNQGGCSVTIAKNGQEALDLIEKNQFDLIFMDIGLPDMDGFQATRSIRHLKNNPNCKIPIIALTAHMDKRNKDRCLQEGMNDVITKPISAEQVFDLLKKFIKKKQNLPFPKTKIQAAEITSKKGVHNQIPVIDLQLGATLISGTNEKAMQMIKRLVGMLPADLANIKTAFTENNYKKLGELVHYIKGGIGYCGTPRLKDSVDELDRLIKTQADKHLIPTAYKQLCKEILAVISEYDKMAKQFPI